MMVMMVMMVIGYFQTISALFGHLKIVKIVMYVKPNIINIELVDMTSNVVILMFANEANPAGPNYAVTTEIKLQCWNYPQKMP